MGRVVMVTGVSRHLGGRVARMLRADPSVERVIGVDVVPPRHDAGALSAERFSTTPLGDVEFVRADIRNPIIAKVIAQAEVDTVVHMAVIATPTSRSSRAVAKEINVIGTMQLLAACQKAPSVRRLVVKSSAAVYGSSAKDPAMFTEDMEPRRLPRSGFAKDSLEVEGYVRGFARRRPDVAVTLLRLANVVGPDLVTPLTAYFSLPLVPTPLGFDARLQLLHEDDAVEVLRRAATEQHEGTYNVAGEGVLLLSQAVRRAGRVALPLPPAVGGLAGQVFRRAGIADFSSEQMDFLSHGRVVDCARLHEKFGFSPAYTTDEAFEDFVRGQHVRGPLTSEAVAAVEQEALRLLGVLVPAARPPTDQTEEEAARA